MVSLSNNKEFIDPTMLQLTEKVVHTRRISKVVKGGRHLRFNAMVVVGDGQGIVGVGLGKAEAIPDAVRKANAIAQKNLIKVPLRDSTIPQEIRAKFNSANILLKPASSGRGIIASGAIRAVMELAGINDVVAKSLGSRNPINVIYGTLEALRKLKDPAEELVKRKGIDTVGIAPSTGDR